MTILITGGGIGGLCCAIALAQNGLASHVFEQAETFDEVGAGIQIGPNGMAILAHWGVGELLERKGATPKAVRLYDGLHGLELNHVPLGDFAQQRYGAPYRVFHRNELHTALLEKARCFQEITISTGFQVKQFVEHATDITVHSDSGDKITGRLLIGADGLWSGTRAQLFPGHLPSFHGKTAWRALVSQKNAPAPFNRLETGLWMAPNAHLVHYPVRGGDEINIVAVINEGFNQQGWTTTGQRHELLPHFEHWDDAPRKFLASVKDWQKWALFDLTPLPHWSAGRTTLLGDAAHPPLPFLAQGGSMAIEDAFVLANLIQHYDHDHESAFRQYERQRHPRTTRVMKQASKMGKIYHMKGLMRLARNMVLTHKSPESLLADYDWLYGFEFKTNS